MSPTGYQKSFISDLLFTLGVNSSQLPSRVKDLAWDVSENSDSWRIWQQPGSDGWKGYPLRFITIDGWKIWLIGELYGVGEKLEITDELLKKVILGYKSPEQLNGHFLLIACEAATGALHVWTNRFGTIHAYHTHDGQRTGIGTFFPAVAAVASKRRLDRSALTGFFAFGFFPQDRTYFEDVRILRPASHYVFENRGRLLHQDRYWQWRHEPDDQRSYDDTVAEFACLFQEVMRDQTGGGRLAVPISGGLDSRSTVAAIGRLDEFAAILPHLWSYSYGYSDDSVETRIARQVAGARGIPFSAFTIKPYLFDRLDHVLASVEGFQDVTQCRQAGVVEEISQRADFLLAAHWGDVWLDDMGLVSANPPDDLTAYAMHKIEKGGGWLLANFRQSHVGDGSEAILREMVQQELTLFNHIEDLDFRIKAFKTDQWSFRWTTASLRMFQAGAFPRVPFYDTRLADFFCTVPSKFVQQRRLQIDYLKRFAPDLARIKWQVYDANLFRYQFFNTWQVPQRAFKKAWRLVCRKQVMERNWEVQFLNPRGRHGLEHWLVRPGLRLHEFFSPGALAALLNEFYQNPLAQSGYTVSMLLTLSVWLEYYG
jgi:asparagine synthase (glutamine-hydrolysing)